MEKHFLKVGSQIFPKSKNPLIPIRWKDRKLSYLNRIDQGVKFTNYAFVGRFKKKGIEVNMGGKRIALDNVFVERSWKSVKYKNIFPKGYQPLKEV